MTQVRPVIGTERTTRPGRLIVGSVIAGVLLSVLWSYEFVDHVIGANVANTLLGEDAATASIAGTAAGLVFAFVSGLAGTFTACNIAMAASIGPMSEAGGSAQGTLRSLLRPLGFFTAGMVGVSAVYGAVGVLIGPSLPQLSSAMVGDMPVRLVQSAVVFGVVGLAMAYLGLAALGVLPDVFRGRPVARVVVLGALVGAFLIGRPYPMFIKLFRSAVDSGNPLFGAGTFVLQSIGNVLLVTVVFAALALGTKGRFLRWFGSNSRRSAVVSAALLISLGVFLLVYWDVRVPSIFGIGWFPTMPYN
ncbi:hypothetical protein IOD16_17550 [Saccharothrix sp. 6-C]|uniref:Cytochrome C biogenesis DsbD-like protein n=1 Tax=Saccharothrix texasensis TaxID=103734 RepID=A0A3N1GZE3_9PSEU|nr:MULTISPECIES: hypothetical protein [Saccharothrix]QQQ80026.1 hypothetical protein IOD16_17550 [Saccharothrix sp. 6-C]ROP35618.1 hypothetical protein EDD40_0856 [Saccharothrix texasensis]